MERYSVRSILLFAVLFPVCICSARIPASRAASVNPLDVFLSSQSQTSWRSFEDQVRSRRYIGPDERLFFHLWKFLNATGHRDLPNSMALVGMTPDQFVDRQIKQANLALAFIRKHQTRNLWLVIDRLATQTFDDELIFHSCELAIRLSPNKFNALADKVVKLHPGNKWIVQRTRERWLVQWRVVK